MPEPTDKIAPAEGSKTDKQPAEKAPEAAPEGQQPEEKKEQTVGDLLETKPEAKPTPKKDDADTVPIATFLDMKKENKEMKAQLVDLQKKIEAGGSRAEITADLQEIAAEWPEVDPKFLKKFADTVRAQAKAEAKEDVEASLKPLKEKERSEKINAAFETHYAKAIEANPEFKDVANKEIIKSLSLMPANANKTFTQLIEESYGHLVPGKRTLDVGSSRAGKNDNGDVDTARAQKDPEYFKEVMANPALKKKYNDSLISRISSQL